MTENRKNELWIAAYVVLMLSICLGCLYYIGAVSWDWSL